MKFIKCRRLVRLGKYTNVRYAKKNDQREETHAGELSHSLVLSLSIILSLRLDQKLKTNPRNTYLILLLTSLFPSPLSVRLIHEDKLAEFPPKGYTTAVEALFDIASSFSRNLVIPDGGAEEKRVKAILPFPSSSSSLLLL